MHPLTGLTALLLVTSVSAGSLPPNLPLTSTQLYTCPPNWTYFCFRAGTPPDAFSACECYRMTPPTSTCPEGTQKYCSDYITTECSCSYPKQPDCPPMFDFECVPSKEKRLTWECTCSGRVWGEQACPRGFTSRCGPGGSRGKGRGCKCKKTKGYLSEYTPRPGKGKKQGRAEAGQVADEGGWVRD